MKRPPPRRAAAGAVLGALLAAAFSAAGCSNMKHQIYGRTEEPSGFQPGGTTAQVPPPHTVPHRDRLPSEPFVTGMSGGKLLTKLPIPLSAQLLARGRERFEIYCSVCHGSDGYGDGIVVRRGFPAPPSYHEARLVEAPIGYFFWIMTRGYGMMYPYSDRLTAADRWAVAAYIRALQLSQRADVRLLSAGERERLGKP